MFNSGDWKNGENKYNVSDAKYVRIQLKHGDDNIVPTAGSNCTIKDSYRLYSEIERLKGTEKGDTKDTVILNDAIKTTYSRIGR